MGVHEIFAKNSTINVAIKPLGRTLGARREVQLDTTWGGRLQGFLHVVAEVIEREAAWDEEAGTTVGPSHMGASAAQRDAERGTSTQCEG